MAKHPAANIIDLPASTIIKENDEYGFKIHHLILSDNKQLLITDGLRNYTQDVNDDNKDLKHIELYVALPDYWNIQTKSWPVTWLNKIAQVPQKNNTWFGVGDTIPAGNPPEALDEKLSANHFIISRPVLYASIFTSEHWNDSDFRLLSIIPIFQNELEFKLNNSHTMLFKRLFAKNVTEEIDLYRQTSYKKRFFGMFGN